MTRLAKVQSTAVAEATALPDPLSVYLKETLGQVDLLGDDTESLWAVGQRGLQMEMAGRIIAGRAFKALCERSHNLSEELAQRRIPRRTFYDAIDVYNLYAELPDPDTVRALAQVGQTKAIAIARWPREDAIALASGQKVRGITLDDAIELSTRDFTQAIRDPELVSAERKLRDQELEIDGLQAELKGLKDALRHRFDVLKMPAFAARARQESVALCEQIALSLTAIEELITDQLITSEDAKTWPDWAERAAGTLYHALRGTHARTQAVLQNMEEQYGERVTGRLDFDYTLSDGEVLAAKDALEIITKRHKVAASNRDAERQNAAGKRGRPRKLQAVD